MAVLFENSSLAGINLKNRVFRSATHEGLADEKGRPREELSRLYEKLSQGGVGAIITGFIAVQNNGRVVNNALLIDNDGLVRDYKKLLVPLKNLGTPVIAQLAHGGGQVNPAVKNFDPVAPSKVKYTLYGIKPRAMNEAEINEVIESFVQAVRRAKEAGFDGVQLHAAHGYLLSSFLSPHANRRTDNWGGSTENRFRIVEEIVRGARKEAGSFPLLIKISAYDGDKNGMTVPEAVKIAWLFEQSGGDAVEVSCGGITNYFYFPRPTKTPVEAIVNMDSRFSQMPALTAQVVSLLIPLVFKPIRPLHNYNVAAAAEIKKHVDIPVIVVGGLRRLSDMEKIVETGQADYVSLSRPLIDEPALVNNFKSGRQSESKCIDCDYCLIGVGSRPLCCYHGKLPAEKPEAALV